MKLEEQNFRIDSKGWETTDKKGEVYLQNAEKDVFELENGEQLFTWDAAMRETKKAGKRLPTYLEFEKLVKTIEAMPNLTFPGYLISSGSHLNDSEVAYWSSEKKQHRVCARYMNLESLGLGWSHGRKDYAYSVRCIKKT